MKKKAEEVAQFLDCRCIFLVGMMGSGKSTVGKILAEALDYSFSDSDRYVEQCMDGTSVAQIIQQHGEAFFRELESGALRKLSKRRREVVSTGGGAVLRPINREYMRKGITIFLDVPVDTLARRIAAVGTISRPLLNFGPGDPYTRAFRRLSVVSKKRADAYACADARVSIQNVAAKLEVKDVGDVTPTDTAMELLLQLENLRDRGRLKMGINRLSYFVKSVQLAWSRLELCVVLFVCVTCFSPFFLFILCSSTVI